MILSDRSISARLDGDLEVTPTPSEEQIQPASLDVRLGSELYDVEADERMVSDTHTLQPGRQYLGHTREEITLPNDLAAQLTGRSTVGRMGVIVHKTAGWIDPSFSGQVTLELYNMSHEPVSFDVGDRIGQLVFIPLDRPSSGYSGQYQGQTGATEHGSLD